MREPDPPDVPSRPGRERGVRAHRGFTLQSPIILAESALYVLIVILLVVAAACALVDTASDVVRGGEHRDVTDLGLFILERSLLLFMIAELLATLRVIDFGRRIVVQPFLLIGMIAAVRRILVATAEFEGGGTRAQLEDFLLEMAGLGGLTLALALAFWLTRGARA
jgi:uncharacterized membrane protein (DUF373 family)